MNYLVFWLIHGAMKKTFWEDSWRNTLYLPSSHSPTSCQMTQNAEMLRVRGEAWCLGLKKKVEHKSESSQINILSTLELIKQTENWMGIYSYLTEAPLPSLTLCSDTGHGSPYHFGKPISVYYALFTCRSRRTSSFLKGGVSSSCKLCHHSCALPRTDTWLLSSPFLIDISVFICFCSFLKEYFPDSLSLSQSWEH